MGETKETVRYFILGDSEITADGDCNHEIKRHLLLGRKALTKPDSVLKSRDITLSTKVHIVKAMVFPLVMYGYDSIHVKESSPAPPFESINSLVLSLLYGPTLTSIHDYWKNHSFD